jgi:hypothetical protein
VYVEHFGFSLFGSRKRESHEQDGEALSRVHHAQIETASGDPAMAFLVFHRLARTDTPFAHSAAIS